MNQLNQPIKQLRPQNQRNGWRGATLSTSRTSVASVGSWRWVVSLTSLFWEQNIPEYWVVFDVFMFPNTRDGWLIRAYSLVMRKGMVDWLMSVIQPPTRNTKGLGCYNWLWCNLGPGIVPGSKMFKPDGLAHKMFCPQREEPGAYESVESQIYFTARLSCQLGFFSCGKSTIYVWNLSVCLFSSVFFKTRWWYFKILT